MFGLGKSRKIRDGYIQHCSAILGTYKLARTLGQHIIDESGLDEFGSKLYEATYLLGVFDSIAQAIDQEGKYLTQDFILEAANHCLVGYEIFPEDEVEGIMSFPVLAQNNPASKIPCHEKEKTVQIAIDRKNRLFQEGNFRYIIDEDSPGVLRASNLVRVGGYSFPKPNWVHKEKLLKVID